MKYKSYTTLSAALLAVALSAPTADAYHMYDYSLGNFEIYGGVNATPYNNLGVHNTDVRYSGGEKNKPYYGIIAGLGNNFAFEYRYADNNLDDHLNFADIMPGAIGVYPFDGKVSTQEYRLKYRANKYLEVFVENYHFDGKGHLSLLGDLEAQDDRLAVGAQYFRRIGHSTGAWVGATVGKNMEHAEAGITYSINKHLNLDVSYQYTMLHKIATVHVPYGPSFDLDTSSSGIYTGLSYRF